MAQTTAPAASGIRGESRVVLRNVSWSLYQQIAAARGDRPVPRLSFSHGVLELTSPSHYHEVITCRLRMFVFMLARGLGLTCLGAGSTRWERVGLEAGKEPDGCFYPANEPLIRGRDDIDLTIHPPPDLAIEVELTHPLHNALPIDAALGVPELWRCTGDSIRFLHPRAEGTYADRPTSLSFPTLRPADVLGRLLKAGGTDLIAWSIEVEAFARDELSRRAVATDG